MKHLMLKALAASVAFGLATGSAFAAQGTQQTVNPYSPAHGHSYRHGVVPTLAVHQKMKAYAAAHSYSTQSETNDGSGASGASSAASSNTDRRRATARAESRSSGSSGRSAANNLCSCRTWTRWR